MKAREEYRRLVEKLEFQEIADTPTVRYYTDWSIFRARMDSQDASNQHELPRGIPLKPDVLIGLDVEYKAQIRGVDIVPLFNGRSDSSPGMKPFTLFNVNTKMQAYHAYRWVAGAKIVVEPYSDFGRLVVASTSGDGYTGNHVVIDVGEGAKGEIVFIDYAGEGAPIKTIVQEVRVGPKAEVSFYGFILHSKDSAVYSIRITSIEEEARVAERLAVMGGAMTRFQDDNMLRGRLSMLDLKASNIARPGTKTDVLLSSLHYGPESEGMVDARGVVLGDGYLSQRGVSMLGEEARWASSEVISYVTILGEKGKGYATPVLEIHTGDVTKAGHSAAVTTISEDLLFYARSRGFSEDEVAALLLEGIVEYSGVASHLGIDIYKFI